MGEQTGQATDNQNAATGSQGATAQSAATGSSLLDTLTAKTATGNGQAAGEPAKAGEGSVPTATGGEVTPETLAEWGAQLPKEIKENPDAVKVLAKFGKLGDLANGYLELQKKLGNSLSIPGENASSDEIAAYHKRIGVPESAEKYSFKQDGAAEKEFASLALKNGMTDKQAIACAGFFSSTLEAIKAARENANVQQIMASDQALKEKYGSKYPEAIAHIERAVRSFGGEAFGKVLQTSGLAGHPAIIELLIMAGTQMSEASATNRGGSGVNSAIRSINDGGSFGFKLT
jgi:hypothetical protein